MVTAREGYLFAVHDNILVTLQEFLLEALSIDHGRAQVDAGWVKATSNGVVVPGADLEVDAFEVAFGAAVQRLIGGHQMIAVKRGSLLSLFIGQLSNHFVESGWSSSQIHVLGVELLTGGHIV